MTGGSFLRQRASHENSTAAICRLLERPDAQADGPKIVSIGWSSGGHLVLSLAWTAPERGLQPPQGVLGFYFPTDYEDPCFPPAAEARMLRGVGTGATTTG